jgi:hypothetical protein
VVKVPPPAAGPAKSIVNNHVAAPAKPVASITPHYYAAHHSPHADRPSAKKEMQNILSPFGGNN